LWIKIIYETSNDECIIIPDYFAKKLDSECTISFGKKSLKIKVVFSNDLEYIGNSTFDKPMIIKLSDKLKDKLFIPDSQTYRTNIKGNNIIIGPVIGFMLGRKNHNYSSKYMKKYTNRLRTYNKIGGLIFAFSPTAVDWKKEIVYGLYYNFLKSKWVYGVFPIPSVIYSRSFRHKPEIVKKLSMVTDGKLFNSHRYTKLELFELVKIDKELAKHLPPTEASQSYDQLKNFIDTHIKVILKPIGLSRGRGICVIEKINSSYKVFDYRSKKHSEFLLKGDDALLAFFNKNTSFFNKYLIQKYLRLAQIDNRRFDIRVVMQKKDLSGWSCTGIECRVASPNTHITNISRGGFAYSLDETLDLAFEINTNMKQKITKQINEYCLNFCKHMDKFGEHFAEFGMDIALDEDKRIWLIESNVLPSFNGFKKMDYNIYCTIRYAPLLYALSLTELNETNIGG